uniref:Ribonuclease VapC n=1 Tax=candidate division WOR-3 bacterium TaxID=2052148 RepID=A0A7C6EFM5_UNCW3
MVVLDASVILKWFIEENDSEKARAILNRYIKGDFIIVVPDFLLYEVANVLKYSGAFSEKEVTEAITSLYDLEIKIISSLPDVIKTMIKLSFQKGITSYDAIYLALAMELQVPLITADVRLSHKINDIKYVKLLKDFAIPE